MSEIERMIAQLPTFAQNLIRLIKEEKVEFSHMIYHYILGTAARLIYAACILRDPDKGTIDHTLESVLAQTREHFEEVRKAN